MKMLLILFFVPGFLSCTAQDKASRKMTYYCSPCGCEYDGKIFDSAGKCPKCQMHLIVVGTFNYEGPVVSKNGILIYSSNQLDNKRQLFYKRLNARGTGQLIREGGLPQLSRDGKSIVFENKGNIFIFSLEKKKLTNVSIGLQLVNPQTPCWSADGAGIYFAAGEFPSIGIYRLNLADNKIESINITDGMRYAPASSPDGKKIAYRCRVGKTNDDVKRGIAVFDLQTKEEKFITNIGEYCSWSPDGKQLSFHWPDSSDFGIYIVNVDGSSIKRIAFNKGGDNELPSWSPDGKKIYFQTNRRRGNWEIWRMNPDGTAQEPVL